jgi:AGZA family xanthine/uracil permease-like MFS transporter
MYNRSTPRGRWLYAFCGFGTILGSFLGAGPLLISPESAPGLKAGARTGLSVVVCGCLFLGAVAVGPILASAPVAGTAPVLLMIG